MTSHTEHVGSPGAHATHLKNNAARDMAMAAGGALALGLLAVLLLAFNPLLALVAAAGAAGSGWWVTQRRPDYEKARVGARSERRVAKALGHSGVEMACHGLMLGAGGDADHIVLGPCAAVVETKTGRGRVQADREGITANGRRMHGNPISQARRQAAALGKKIGCYVTAIVCVVDMEGAPIQVGDIWVCSVNDLPSLIRSLPAVGDSRWARQQVWKLNAA